MSFRQCRRVADITQKEAARKLGVHQSTVALWERGKTSPRAGLLPKIAKLYGCTVDELLEPGKEKEEPNAKAETAGKPV